MTITNCLAGRLCKPWWRGLLRSHGGRWNTFVEGHPTWRNRQEDGPTHYRWATNNRHLPSMRAVPDLMRVVAMLHAAVELCTKQCQHLCLALTSEEEKFLSSHLPHRHFFLLSLPEPHSAPTCTTTSLWWSHNQLVPVTSSDMFCSPLCRLSLVFWYHRWVKLNLFLYTSSVFHVSPPPFFCLHVPDLSRYHCLHYPYLLFLFFILNKPF